MRKLTIKRNKTFVASATKVLFCIVNNYYPGKPVPQCDCEILGKVKNGETLQVEIPETKVTIAAAYDSLGVFMITDVVIIPAGSDDIMLEGKAKLNPAVGNPFIFKK